MGRTLSYRTLGLPAGEAEYFGPGGWTPLRAESAVTFHPPLSWPLRWSAVDRLPRSKQSISHSVGAARWCPDEPRGWQPYNIRDEAQAYRGRLVGSSVSLRAALRISLSLLAHRVLRSGSLVRSFSSLAGGISSLARPFALATWRNRRPHLEPIALREAPAGGRDEAFSRRNFLE